MLIIRKKALEDERIKLASILNVYNQQIDILHEMEVRLAELKSNSEKYLTGNEFNPNMIASYNSYSCKLAQDIKTQHEIINKTKINVEKQQELAKIAYINVKSIEKLKEKQKEQYDKEFLQEEIKTTDDIVNSRRTA